MILLGIDEAGLGPTLGPLVSGLAAIRTPDGWTLETPWEALSEAVTAKWKKDDPRIAVGDSKKIYPVGGLAALEKTTLAVLGQIRPSFPDSRDELLRGLDAEEWIPDLAAVPWHRNEWTVPGHTDAAAAARLLTESLAGAGAEIAALRVRIAMPARLNQTFDSGLNKDEALLAETGAHLAWAAAAFPGEEIVAVVDRQGGRAKYGAWLSGLFPDAWIETVAEGAKESSYRWRTAPNTGKGTVSVTFAVGADGKSFAVALASLAAKYVRERCMADLNDWFTARIGGLRRTAGYPGDAPRFLREVEGVVAGEGIRRDALVRKR